MILSGRDIQWYIERGFMKINPVQPEQFQQNGIDLILEDLMQVYLCMQERVEVKRPEGFQPQSFYLGCTREILSLPDDIMGFVELRSTYARNGLMIPPTIIDAGFQGNITLEIVSFLDEPVPYGQPFAHIVFGKLTSPAISYRGKYFGQRGITGAQGLVDKP